jgi:hypothetical protein
VTEAKSPPPPRLRLERTIDPNAITLLDFYAAALVIAHSGSSSIDIFNKAAALVAESHTRKGRTP